MYINFTNAYEGRYQFNFKIKGKQRANFHPHVNVEIIWNDCEEYIFES